MRPPPLAPKHKRQRPYNTATCQLEPGTGPATDRAEAQPAAVRLRQPVPKAQAHTRRHVAREGTGHLPTHMTDRFGTRVLVSEGVVELVVLRGVEVASGRCGRYGRGRLHSLGNAFQRRRSCLRLGLRAGYGRTWTLLVAASPR